MFTQVVGPFRYCTNRVHVWTCLFVTCIVGFNFMYCGKLCFVIDERIAICRLSTGQTDFGFSNFEQSSVAQLANYPPFFQIIRDNQNLRDSRFCAMLIVNCGNRRCDRSCHVAHAKRQSAPPIPTNYPT